MDSYDAIVIGGGIAGLSGALVLARCMRRVLVLDSGRYRNAASRALHCFLGHDGVAPAELLECARRQLEPYDSVVLVASEATAVSRSGDDFAARMTGMPEAHARTVLVATGVVDEIPPLPGIVELWGRTVHVCPYCDGYEHRGGPVAVYGRGSKGAGLALLLRQWTDDLVVLTDGDHGLGAEEMAQLRRRGIAVEEARVERLEGNDGQLRAVHFAGGGLIRREALFFNTGQHQRSPLPARLGCDLAADRGVICDSEGRTSVPGVYVAGDVSRDVQLAIVAASEGARAALAINKDLLERDHAL